MLFILSLGLKEEVEGCSVHLMCLEEGDLVQKNRKKELSKEAATKKKILKG